MPSRCGHQSSGAREHCQRGDTFPRREIDLQASRSSQAVTSFGRSGTTSRSMRGGSTGPSPTAKSINPAPSAPWVAAERRTRSTTSRTRRVPTAALPPGRKVGDRPSHNRLDVRREALGGVGVGQRLCGDPDLRVSLPRQLRCEAVGDDRFVQATRNARHACQGTHPCTGTT
jgi:hypothetical protein